MSTEITIKVLEVRDRATCLPILAWRLETEDPREQALLRRAGFGGASNQRGYVMVAVPGKMHRCTYDPFAWTNSTMRAAHRWLQDHDNFLAIPHGGMIDIPLLTGQSTTPMHTDIGGDHAE